MSARDQENIIWSIAGGLGGLAVVLGGIVAHDEYKKYELEKKLRQRIQQYFLNRRIQQHFLNRSHYDSAYQPGHGRYLALPNFAPASAPAPAPASASAPTSASVQPSAYATLPVYTPPPFIIGTSNETYTGYRKVTCEDWNKITFRKYFVDFYKDNKGIENKMTENPESTMLVFDRSKPKVNDCQIEVVNVTTKPNCQLSYCTTLHNDIIKYFNLETITDTLLNDSTCYALKNDKHYHTRSISKHRSNLFRLDTIFPCLFVHDNVTVGARRSRRKRTQKKR